MSTPRDKQRPLQSPVNQSDHGDQDSQLWDLLAGDAVRHPISTSPWFATRVAAQALTTPQTGRRSAVSLPRWLIPIPLACSALIALASWNHSRESQEKFEQHMEFLASSDYEYEV